MSAHLCTAPYTDLAPRLERSGRSAHTLHVWVCQGTMTSPSTTVHHHNTEAVARPMPSRRQRRHGGANGVDADTVGPVLDTSASTTPLYPVYTWGYRKRQPGQLKALCDTLATETLAPVTVMDTRHKPGNATLGWSNEELAHFFGTDTYTHNPGFGNLNYGGARARHRVPPGAIEGVPILADFEAALACLIERCTQGPVILFCACVELGECHRHVISKRLAEVGILTVELQPRGTQTCKVSACCGGARSSHRTMQMQGTTTASSTHSPQPSSAHPTDQPKPRRRGRGTTWSEVARSRGENTPSWKSSTDTLSHSVAAPTPTPSATSFATAASGTPFPPMRPDTTLPKAATDVYPSVPNHRARAANEPNWYARRGQDNEPMTTYPIMTPAELAPLTIEASDMHDNPAKLRDILHTHGVAVVANVVSPDDCQALEGLWRRDLLSLVDKGRLTDEHLDVVRDLESGSGIEAWPGACDPHMGPAWRGFATQRGLPHGHFAWACRLHPSVRSAFAAVHDVADPNDMCVGLDNVMWQGFSAPSAEDNVEWLHCDQNHNTGLRWPIAQGILYVRPSTGHDVSTTVVWPGSHADTYHTIMSDPYAKAQGRTMKGQLIKLNLLQSEQGKAVHAAAVEGARRVPVPAGSLLLWDSRTTHQGWCGGPRLAQPVCWEPRERRDAAALRRKLWMCATGVGSTHSSTEGRVHQMAPRAQADPLPGSDPGEFLRLPLVPTLVPYGVRDDRLKRWERMQPKLCHPEPDGADVAGAGGGGRRRGRWGRGHDARKNADRVDIASIRPLLRDDVLNAI
eukprot:m.51379 g.51379  ORF g.51379 m.51379 type:complete len:799 (-) comp7301_c0_seq1:220-2616(-)